MDEKSVTAIGSSPWSAAAKDSYKALQQILKEKHRTE
jgi:hypothetical protein